MGVCVVDGQVAAHISDSPVRSTARRQVSLFQPRGCSHRQAQARSPAQACPRSEDTGLGPSTSGQGSRCITNAQAATQRGTAPAPSGSSRSIRTTRRFGFATNFDDLYTFGPTVGAGSFGTVRIATEKASGERRAVKTVTKRFLGGYMESHFVRRVQHEVDIYGHIGHSLNVAYLYGAYEDDKSVHLVMELCTGGELWDRVRVGKYSERAAAELIQEILMTLAQCHAKGIVIRDVKPENFLFLNKDSPRLKMIDFGCSDYCGHNETLTDRAGTPLYVAPEVLRQKYGLKADVWSAGIIAYQLLAGRLPFTDEDGNLVSPDLDMRNVRMTNKDIFACILYRGLDFEQPPWDHLSQEAGQFVQSLLQRDPANRPTATEALSHPWLTQWQGRYDCERPLCDTLVQRLQRYGTYGRLKQVALQTVVGFMAHDSSRLAALRAAFSGVDTDGTGKVPFTKVVALLKGGGFDLSPTEASQLLATFHIDEEGMVDYSEWLASLVDWHEVQSSPEWNELVERVFDTFDVEHAGVLTQAELERVLCGGEDECPISDIVPATFREVEESELHGDRSDYLSVSSSAGTGAVNTSQGGVSAGNGAGNSTSSSGSGNGAGVAATAVPRSRIPKAGPDGTITREEFKRLLRSDSNDRLSLFPSRKPTLPAVSAPVPAQQLNA